MLGGALGNIADRILRGSVVDLLDVHWQDIHWPAFNLADVCCRRRNLSDHLQFVSDRVSPN